MAKMRYYATVDELIQQIKTADISYRNLHTPVFIRYTDRYTGDMDTYKIPYKSVIGDYMPVLRSTAILVNFDEREATKYKFKPKMLSNDLYGTTELWSALLELNYFVSIIDFRLDKPIRVFDPQLFKNYLNEVMILEGILS